jgi:protein involved in ribonucleotide reduction
MVAHFPVSLVERTTEYMKQLLSLAILGILLITSCRKDGGATSIQSVSILRVNRASLTLSGNAIAMDSLHIQSDVDWKIEVDASAAGWLKVDKIQGSGNSDVKLTADADNLGKLDRTGTLQVIDVAGKLPTVTVKVTQTVYVTRPFSRVWGGVKADYFTTVTQVADGGYAMAGYSSSNDGDFVGNRGSMDMLVIRTDADGNRLWQKTYGGSGYDAAAALLATPDGGFLMAGQTTSTDGDVTNAHGNNDFWLMKLDASGNKVWSKAYGGSGYDGATSMAPAPDGGFIIVGYASSSNGDVSGHLNDPLNFYDVWVLKVDASGNKVWDRNYGGAGDDLASTVHTAPGGGYYIGGYTQSNNHDFTGNHGKDDAFLMKIDENGTMAWSHLYGGSQADAVQALDVDRDGNILLATSSYSADGDIGMNRGGSDFCVIRTDPSGMTQWKQVFGGSGNDFIQSVIANPDGSLMVAGWSLSNDLDFAANYGSADAWVLKLDAAGSNTWKKNFGGLQDDVAMAIIRDSRKGFLIAGDAASKNQDLPSNRGQSDAWLLKFSEP